jgi:hypothetical protein
MRHAEALSHQPPAQSAERLAPSVGRYAPCAVRLAVMWETERRRNEDSGTDFGILPYAISHTP